MNRSRSGAFWALQLLLGATLAACGSGGGASPAPTATATSAPTVPPSAYTTASCSTSGTTSANVTGNVAGLVTLALPAIGGCSYTNSIGTVITNASAGTYAATISFSAPTGLPSVPATNTCAGNCANNAPPSGFSAANFVPLFYVTLQLSGFVGVLSPDNPNIAVAVNSIVSSSNSLNFFIGSWTGNVPGSTAPAASGTNFTGWSNNNNASAFGDVPLTITPPTTLTLPTYLCQPVASCPSTNYTTPQSFTLIQVVGYFN